MLSISKKLGVSRENTSLMYGMYFGFLCSGFLSTLIGAVLPAMSAEYKLSYLVQGSIISAHQIGNFIAVLVAGFLPNAIGRKKSTLLLDSGKALGLSCAVLTGNPVALLPAFALTGVGRGCLSNITNVVMAEISPKKASALNILHSTFAVGALASPFLVMLFKDAWRVPLLLLIAMELISLIWIGSSNLSGKSKKPANSGKASFLSSPIWWINTAILFFYLCTEASIIGWLVTYLKDSGRMSIAMAQSCSSLLWVMILIGRLSCASLSQRISKNLLLLILGIGQSICFVMMITIQSPVMTIISVLLFGLFLSGTYPTTLATMPTAFNSSTVATGTCIALASLGAIIMPSIIGAIAQASGLVGAIGVICIALGAMLSLMTAKAIIEKRKAIEG